MRRSARWSRPWLYLLLAAVAAAYALPLVWMGLTSLKPPEEALRGGASLLPDLAERDEPAGPAKASAEYWDRWQRQIRTNYAEVMQSPVADFRTYLRNSLIVSTLSVVGMVASSAVVAYGFSRLRWKGRDRVFLLVLATMMIPFPVIMGPQYLLFKHLGWIGTLRPLWLPAFFSGAFTVFLLRQFFLTLPRELDEAATLDGCSHAGIFRHVILPLSRPALAVAGLLQFVASWNDFVGPLVFLNHQEKYTASLGLQMYQTQHGGTPWNLVMAATVIVIAPVVLVFVAAQRMLIEGVATQGLKE